MYTLYYIKALYSYKLYVKHANCACMVRRNTCNYGGMMNFYIHSVISQKVMYLAKIC